MRDQTRPADYFMVFSSDKRMNDCTHIAVGIHGDPALSTFRKVAADVREAVLANNATPIALSLRKIVRRDLLLDWLVANNARALLTNE